MLKTPIAPLAFGPMGVIIFTRSLAASDRVKMITEIGPNKSGAIGVYGIDGMDMGKLGGWLLSKHNIVTTPMVTDEFKGMRITPNVYTTVDEVDLFADRVLQAIRKESVLSS